MKIAVSSRSDRPDDTVDPRFGRAAGFLVFDTVTSGVTFLDNSANVDAPQGAGIQSAQLVVDAGAEVVVTGRVGPKALDVLNRAGVRIVEVGEVPVQQAVQQAMGQAGGSSQPAQGATPQQSVQQGQGGGCRRTGGTGRGMGMGGGGGRGMGGGGRGMGGGGRGMGGGR